MSPDAPKRQSAQKLRISVVKILFVKMQILLAFGARMRYNIQGKTALASIIIVSRYALKRKVAV